jgi:hypothetical protein
MAETLATKTSLAGYEMPGTFEPVRAEALFVSTLQPSGSPSPDQIRRAVATTLQRLGLRGCAAQVAGEFGDHPDTAVARMGWALATINTALPVAVNDPGSRTAIACLRKLIVGSRVEL